MEVTINWLAVGLAVLSSMAVGAFWYAKPVFGIAWAKMVNLDDKKMEKGAPRALSIALVMAFFEAYIIAHVAFLSKQFFETSTLQAGLGTAFWLWVGISATTIIVHDVFEQRPVRLTLMNVGNQFFTLMAMGLIIGLLGKF